MVNWC